MQPPQPKRLQEVASEAGVSTATVDRVLNGRKGVRATTVAKVQAAVDKLGYRPDPAAARLARPRFWRLAFVLPEGKNSFVALLEAEIAALQPWLTQQRAHATVVHADAFSATAAAQAIEGLRGQCDAAIAMVQDHRLVRAAIDDLADDGVCVLTLVSDVPSRGRKHFVGIDNVAAGRTAGNLLGRFVGTRKGRIGVVLGSHALRDHADRLLGFRQVMDTEHPCQELLPTVEGRDDRETTERLVGHMLQEHPDLAGLYSIGAGNQGISAALKAHGVAGQVVWVCHELTPHSRRDLLEGTAAAVINQGAAHEIRSACRVALAHLTRDQLLADQERIRIDIYLKDNLP